MKNFVEGKQHARHSGMHYIELNIACLAFGFVLLFDLFGEHNWEMRKCSLLIAAIRMLIKSIQMDILKDLSLS